MAPTQPGTRPDFRPPHKAVAYVAANGPPGTSRFYGACMAGDFVALGLHSTQGVALADVAAHLVEVERQPHRAFVNMLREPPHGYVGFCAAGDFSPLIRRATRREAEADVAEHLTAMGTRAATGDEASPSADRVDRQRGEAPD